jgi:hypothetical protein
MTNAVGGSWRIEKPSTSAPRDPRRPGSGRPGAGDAAHPRAAESAQADFVCLLRRIHSLCRRAPRHRAGIAVPVIRPQPTAPHAGGCGSARARQRGPPAARPGCARHVRAQLAGVEAASGSVPGWGSSAVRGRAAPYRTAPPAANRAPRRLRTRNRPPLREGAAGGRSSRARGADGGVRACTWSSAPWACRGRRGRTRP